MSTEKARKGISVERLSKSYGSTVLFEDISFSVEQGEFMVIVGPSGCGKSSLMRVIAGIEEHGTGRVYVDGADVTDAHPGKRSLSMVFQDYALYPHMTVEKNLSFGLRSRRVSKDEIKGRVAETARTVGLVDQLDKKPGQLSGGQRQRVALGRSMIQEPRAFLMDEPLSNLDAALRVQMRTELIEFHNRVKGTILYVTHDQVEAMTMGDRVAVMNKGRFEQVGTPQQIYSQPANLYVARFMGSPRMNILEAVVVDGTITAQDMAWPLGEDLPVQSGDRLYVGMRPESVLVTADAAEVGAASLVGTVEYVEHLGNETIVHLRPQLGDPLVFRMPPRALRIGQTLTVAVPADRLHLFDAGGVAILHPESSAH